MTGQEKFLPNNKYVKVYYGDDLMDYFYDNQIRRYLLQFITIFENLQWKSGKTRNGDPIYRTVPIKLAMTNRQVAAIQRNNSENVINTVPQMSCWIQDFAIARNRTQLPNGESDVQIYERDIDEQTNKYTDRPGRSYSVQRMMAVPYDITMQLDVWSSNEDQKQQIIEQILMLFNPSIDLQTGTNPIDWTSLTIVELSNITWSSRSIPIGTSNEIEVTSLTFKMPIWISPPAKMKKLSIIQQIVLNISEKKKSGYFDFNQGNSETDYISPDYVTENMAQVIVSPEDRSIEVNNNIVGLRTHAGIDNVDGNVLKWEDLITLYGKIRPGRSQLRLKTTNSIENFKNDIVGFLEYDLTDPNNLIWTIDPTTLPANTMPDINAVINPYKSWPGKILPAAQEGQRYLLLEQIHGNVVGWNSLDANPLDIIEFVNGKWEVAFSAYENKNGPVQFVLNIHTGKQLKFINQEWTMAIDGEYKPGYWRIFL
jgi:hypothetical protein